MELTIKKLTVFVNALIVLKFQRFIKALPIHFKLQKINFQISKTGVMLIQTKTAKAEIYV